MAEETKNDNSSEEVKEVTEEQASAEAKKYADKVTDKSVADVVGKEDGVKGFFKNVESLKKYWDDICLIFPLLKDWIAGKYTKIPWSVITSLVGAILYVINPFDLLPDFLPGVGYLDDSTLFGLVVVYAKDFLEEYKIWKKAQDETIDV